MAINPPVESITAIITMTKLLVFTGKTSLIDGAQCRREVYLQQTRCLNKA